MGLIQAQSTDGFPGEHIYPLNQCRTSLNTFLWKSYLYPDITHPWHRFPNAWRYLLFLNCNLNLKTGIAFEINQKRNFAYHYFSFIIYADWILLEGDFATFNIHASFSPQRCCLRAVLSNKTERAYAYIFTLTGIIKSIWSLKSTPAAAMPFGLQSICSFYLYK